MYVITGTARKSSSYYKSKSHDLKKTLNNLSCTKSPLCCPLLLVINIIIRDGLFLSSSRVTGKMVGTASHESVQAGTKLLDIPLNPENNMTAL